MQRHMPFAFCLGSLLTLAAASGCHGNIQGIGNDDRREPGDLNQAGNGTGGGGGTESAGGGMEGTVATPRLCEQPGRVVPAPAPLTRLTNRQIRQTLRDLFPGVALDKVSLDLPAEVSFGGFLNNARAQTPSAELIERLQINAVAVAKVATDDLAKLLPCVPATPADQPACGKQFIASFGRRAFRRPLLADEQAKYELFFEKSRIEWGFPVAVRMLVEAMLQSPNFLYRVEAGGEVTQGPIALNDHEMASRLSYFLTDSMPDEILTLAADAGALGDRKAVEQQVRRLLEKPRARETIANFNAQWLMLDKLRSIRKSSELFPDFNAQTVDSLQAGLASWLNYQFWETDGTLQTFLTDAHAFVDDRTAAIYGVAPPGSGAPALVAVDPGQRSGVLTQAGLLAAFAHERTDAPVLRGLFVLDRLLCVSPPSAPADVNTSLPDVLPTDRMTTRQQMEQIHTSRECIGCHQMIDGVGFAFGNYDASGRWRDSEFGLPIDARGELLGTVDVDGTFEGAVELGAKLARSATVQSCVASRVLGYSLGVAQHEIDGCSLQPIVDGLAASNFDLRELLVATATSDAFRHRTNNP